MTGHGDELLAQAGVFPLMAQRRLGDLVAAFIGELERDQLGKDLECKVRGFEISAGFESIAQRLPK